MDIVPVAMLLELKCLFAKLTMKWFWFFTAVCLFMACKIPGECALEVTLRLSFFVNMVTHVVENFVVIEVHVSSQGVRPVKRSAASFPRTRTLVCRVIAMCLLMLPQSARRLKFVVALFTGFFVDMVTHVLETF